MMEECLSQERVGLKADLPSNPRGSAFRPTASTRPGGSAFRPTVLLAAALWCALASAGPVEVYRDGDRYCPRSLPPAAPRIDAAGAERIARSLVPDGFCGPSASIGGCDVVIENFYDSWRIYVHQYRERPKAHDWAALTHTYVILDPVGNCLANIPGTEPGAPR